MRLIKLLFLLFCFTQSLYLCAAPNKEAQCLLLNQQVNQFSYAPNSPPYKQAKRAYDRECHDLNTQAVETTTLNNSAQTSKEVQSPNDDELARIKAEQLLEKQKQAALKLEQEELAKAQALLEQEQLAEQTAIKQAQLKETFEAQKREKEQLEQQKIPEAQLQKQAELALKTAPIFVAPPLEPTSLLDDLMLPSVIVLSLIIGVLVSLKWLRPRMSQIKEQANTLKEKTIQVSHDLKQKTEQNKRPKGMLSRTKNQLDRDIYQSYKQLTVSLDSGLESKVDRIIVSNYGVFVLLFASQQGAVFGTQAASQWSEQTNGETLSFDNPLQLATRHAFAVGRLLDVNEGVKTVVVFNDAVVFKSPMPENVIHRADMFDYIQSFKQFIFMDEQVDEFNEVLTAQFEQQNSESEQQHIETEPQKPVVETSLTPTKKETGVETARVETQLPPFSPNLDEGVSKAQNLFSHNEKNNELEPFVSPSQFIEQIDETDPIVQTEHPPTVVDEKNDEFDEHESAFNASSRNSDLFATPRADYSPDLDPQTEPLTNTTFKQEAGEVHIDTQINTQSDDMEGVKSAEQIEITGKAPLNEDDTLPSDDMQSKSVASTEQLDEVAAFLTAEVGDVLANTKRTSYLVQPQFKEPVVREYKPVEEPVVEQKNNATIENVTDFEPDSNSNLEPDAPAAEKSLLQATENPDVNSEKVTAPQNTTGNELEFKPLPIAKDLKPLVRNEPKSLYVPQEDEVKGKKDLFANLSLDPTWGVPSETDPQSQSVDIIKKAACDDEHDQIAQQAISFCPQCLSTVVETKDPSSGARIYTCSSQPLCDFTKTIQ